MRLRGMRIRRFLTVLSAVALTGLAVAACGQDSDEGATGGSSTAPSAAPSSGTGSESPGSPGETTRPPDDGKVRPGFADQVIVTKSGGIAGMSQKLVISGDGSWEFTDMASGKSESGTLTADQVATLRAAVESPELMSGPDKDKPDHDCADMVQWGVTVGDTVLRSDSCGQPPNDAFAQITALASEATPI